MTVTHFPARVAKSSTRSSRDLIALALAGLVVLYGVAGYAFPKSLSLVDLTLGLSISLIGTISILSILSSRDQYAQLSVILVLLSLSWGALVGAANGSDSNDMVRDVIPALFMFQFVIFDNLFRQKQLRWILLASAIAGVILAVRFYIQAGALPFVRLGVVYHDSTFSIYEPLVFLSALYCGMRAIRERPSVISAIMLTCSLVCCNAILHNAQRGPFFTIVVVLAVYLFLKRPKIGLASCAALVVVATWNAGALTEILLPLIEKTQVHGLNNKLEEWSDVMDSIGRGLGIFFGQGWGSVLYSSTNSYEGATFTHSLVSYLLLKTGIIGTAMAIVIFALPVVGRRMRGLSLEHVLLFVPVLMNGILFQPVYKTFGYGLVLLLLYGFARSSRASADEGGQNSLWVAFSLFGRRLSHNGI